MGQKMYTSVISEADIPENATNHLSAFLHARDNQIQSRTVEITGLPNYHTIRNMNKMFETVQEKFHTYDPIGDPYYDVEPEEVLHIKSPCPGVGLVQLATPQQAINIVWRFAGTYWRNATLNCRCVPDEEMEDLLVQDSTNGRKDVKLFVIGIKPGSSAKEVRDIFQAGGFPVRDIQIPPGGKTFCFVFFRQEDANAVLAQLGNGFRYQDRMIRVGIAEKSKKKGRTGNVAAAPAAAPNIPPPATKDLKVNGLPYGTAEPEIRLVFQGFTVIKVVVKYGYAYVAVAANEVDRALQELNGKQVGDRNINVRVAERSCNF
jgi:hypothetical protein